MSLHTLFETQVKIGISDADFKKGIAAAGTAVKDFATMGAQAIGNFTKSLVSGVSELASYGDHIDKQSQKMNMSAQAYQEWDAIMQHSGTTIDSMQMSMKTLANAAESGNDAFELLGMSLEDVQQMSSEELFKATITALQNVESDTQRTYIAGQLLGRGATELGALLNTSAEDTEKMRQRVHELGGVMSDEAVKASAKFQDSLQDMKTAMSGLTRGLKAEFLPSFTDVMDGLTMILAGEEGGENKLEQGLANITTTLSRSIDKVKPVVSRLGETVFRQIERNIPHIAKRLSRIAGKIVVNVVNDLPDILSTAGNMLYNVGSELGNQILGILPGRLSDDVKSIFGSVSDFLNEINFEALGETIATFLNQIDWSEIVKSIGSFLATAVSKVPDFLSGFIKNIDFQNAADLAAIFFVPKFIGATATAIASSSTFTSVTTALSTQFSVSAGVAAGSAATTFMGMFAGALVGWEIGTLIRDAIGGENIDEVVWPMIDNWIVGLDELKKEWDEFLSLYTAGWDALGDAIGAVGDAIDKVVGKIKQNWEFWEGFGEYLATPKSERNIIDSNADGGYVTTPRLSWVAEKEPEYIIPESKMDKVFKNNSSGYTFNFYYQGGNGMSDAEIEEQARRLADLSIAQIRAIGGTGF